MIGPGTHLMVDGITLMSFTAPYLERFLRDAVGVVGMKVVAGPFVYGRGDTWDGWVLLAESHATVHIYGEQCHVDLFSCRGFDVEEPVALIRHRLKLSKQRLEVIERVMPEVIYDR
jgi:S-adenosylmethionine/arginine decarboxylase-like enzyme